MSRRRQIACTRADSAAPRFIAISRVLIALIGLLLLATPWTEGYRLLDNFPRGQDSEVHLLALLAFLGLVLLLARSCNRSVNLALTIAFWCSSVLRQLLKFFSALSRFAPLFARHIPPIPAALQASFSLPLQI